jgi:ATP-binding cassette subfamily B protein
LKVVLQDGIKDCGICSLLSIIRFYGGEVSREYLREITNTTKDGVSLYNLLEGAKKIGFWAMGVSGKLENIEVNNLPCIAHLIVNKSYKHFVVIYKINKEKHLVTLMDPAKGKKVISFSEFNLLSSNNYLFLKPVKKLPKMTKKNIIYKNIMFLQKENKIILISIIILTIIFFILNITTSFHFKYLLEFSIKYSLSKNIYFISYLMITLYLLKNINCLLRNILVNKWTSIFDFDTTTTTYEQLLLLPYLYYKNRTTGEVISRFRDLNTIRTYLSNFFTTISTDIFSILIFFIIMFNYSKNLTVIVCIPHLLVIIYLIITSKKKKKLLTKLKNREDSINSYLIQGISNVDTLKGSHLEKKIIDKFKISYKSFQEAIYNYNFFIEISSFFKNNINDLINILIFGIGSCYVINGKLSLSSLIVYQSFFSYFTNCLLRVISVLEEYNSYHLALDRVEEIFMISYENFKNNYFYLPYDLKGDIIYNNLNYKIGSKCLLNNLNLTIKQGEKILLSGPSGCGKSTLMKMLLRYIEVPFNSLSIASIDINHYHLENIRSNITYVTSSEYLFNDTIKNNILLNKEISEEEFLEVCRICLVTDIVGDDINNYNKIIEENGFNFSNGERQRIILARSIIRKSNIFILDEALGQIDINREKKILTNIFQYLEEKTVIVISHRFNNKKLFDRVLRLEDGVIHEN